MVIFPFLLDTKAMRRELNIHILQYKINEFVVQRANLAAYPQLLYDLSPWLKLGLSSMVLLYFHRDFAALKAPPCLERLWHPSSILAIRNVSSEN